MRISAFEADEINSGLFDFLDRSPNPFFAVRNMQETLREAGFVPLYEGERWDLKRGGAYYVSRNGSSLIAFRIPDEIDFTGFMILASHCDSPVFKIKPGPSITVENRYVKLNVEKYGGALCAPWFDRPLSVAGRVIVRTPEGIGTKLVNIDRNLLVIPSLAIHMNREANEGFKYNLQTDLLPLLCETGETCGAEAPATDREYAVTVPLMKPDPERKDRRRDTRPASPPDPLMELVAKEAGVLPEEILDSDLFLYSRTKAGYVGLNREFIMGGRLDDLQCAYASLRGILAAKPSRSIALHCVFDNEEVGSTSKQGAAGTFLYDVLRRINASLGRSPDEYLRSLASSFMVSADNAHSVHPNHPEKADPVNRPRMNGGIVIKYSSNQKYTTDAVSGAVFRSICEKAHIPFQTFANRSDMIGGSTLGNLVQGRVSLNTVDIGLAQLAMHSPCETAGARDTARLAEAARILFSGSLEGRGDGSFTLRF